MGTTPPAESRALSEVGTAEDRIRSIRAARARALRELVDEHDYTVAALAEWLGVSRPTIYAWMRG